MKNTVPVRVAISGAIMGYFMFAILIILSTIALFQSGSAQVTSIFGLIIIFIVRTVKFKKFKWRDFEIEK